MDKIEFYLDGYRFASCEANRDNVIYFAGQKFISALKFFKTCLDIIEPDLDCQLQVARQKVKGKLPWRTDFEND